MSKNNVPEGAMNTIIGKGTKFEGTMDVAQSLRIDGAFKGTLTATDTLIVGSTGELQDVSITVKNAIIGGKIKGKDAGVYIVMQCIGAIIGAGLLFMVASGVSGYDIKTNGLGQNGYGDLSPAHYSMAACLVAEIVLTMIFLLVIFGSTSKFAPSGFAGIPIGLSLVFIHLIGIPITGTSVNPARSLGPALFVGGDALAQLWLFWVGPIVGALIAALIWKYVLEKE